MQHMISILCSFLLLLLFILIAANMKQSRWRRDKTHHIIWNMKDCKKKKMAKTTKKKKMSKSLLCLIFDWSDWWSWWFLNLTSLSNLKRNKAESSDRIKCLFFIFPVLFFFFSFILLNSREKRVQGIDFTVRYLFDFMNSEKKQKRKRLSRLFVILGRRNNVKCEQKTNERRIKW